jgi:hypothetical protein
MTYLVLFLQMDDWSLRFYMMGAAMCVRVDDFGRLFALFVTESYLVEMDTYSPVSTTVKRDCAD